jgi:hypothetical protein
VHHLLSSSTAPVFILSILQPAFCCWRLQLVQTGIITGWSDTPDAKIDTYYRVNRNSKAPKERLRDMIKRFPQSHCNFFGSLTCYHKIAYPYYFFTVMIFM